MAWLIVVYGWILVWSQFAWGQQKEEIFFAPLPMENPQLTIFKSKHLTKALSEKLGVRVQTKYYASYEAILQAFVRGEVDLVELGPFNYLKLKSMTQAFLPLAMIRQYQDQAYYRCVLVAPMDGVQSLMAFTQQVTPSVALTQPLSTCGWFGTEYFFRQQGLDLNQYEHTYIGSHEGVALSLLRAEYSVGSVASHIGQRFADLGLNVLAESPDLPLFSIVGNSETLSAEQLTTLRDYLVNLPLEQTADWGMGRYGFLPFSSSLLESFEGLVQHMQPERVSAQ